MYFDALTLAAVADASPDLVLMDIRMPGRDGFSVCEAIKGRDATRLLPVVLMTGSTERADRVRAIEAGADDFLTKPVDEIELKARVRSLVRLKRYTDDLDSAETVILSLARTIEARDPYTEGHCERLARYAVIVGRRIGVSAEDLARTDMIQQERTRQSAADAMTREEFLASLGLVVDYIEVGETQISRVAQLTNKTNQFNVTTIRRTEHDIRALLDDGNHVVRAISVGDRFGDYGLVGVAIREGAGNVLENQAHSQTP